MDTTGASGQPLWTTLRRVHNPALAAFPIREQRRSCQLTVHMAINAHTTGHTAEGEARGARPRLLAARANRGNVGATAGGADFALDGGERAEEGIWRSAALLRPVLCASRHWPTTRSTWDSEGPDSPAVLDCGPIGVAEERSST